MVGYSLAWAAPGARGSKPTLSEAALKARQDDEDCGPSCAYNRATSYQSQSILLMLKKSKDIDDAADALALSNAKDKSSLKNTLRSHLGSYCGLIGESDLLQCADQWHTMHDPILRKSRLAIHENTSNSESLKSREGASLGAASVGAAGKTLPKYSRDGQAGAKKQRFSRVNKPLTKQDFEAIYDWEQAALEQAANLETEKATKSREYFRPSKSDFSIFETIINETGGTITRPTGKIDEAAYQRALAEYERQVQLGLVSNSTQQLSKTVPESFKKRPPQLFQSAGPAASSAASSEDAARVQQVDDIFRDALTEKLLKEGILSVRSFPGKKAEIPDQIPVAEGQNQTEYSPALTDESIAQPLGIQSSSKKVSGPQKPARVPASLRRNSALKPSSSP